MPPTTLFHYLSPFMLCREEFPSKINSSCSMEEFPIPLTMFLLKLICMITNKGRQIVCQTCIQVDMLFLIRCWTVGLMHWVEVAQIRKESWCFWRNVRSLAYKKKSGWKWGTCQLVWFHLCVWTTNRKYTFLEEFRTKKKDTKTFYDTIKKEMSGFLFSFRFPLGLKPALFTTTTRISFWFLEEGLSTEILKAYGV